MVHFCRLLIHITPERREAPRSHDDSVRCTHPQSIHLQWFIVVGYSCPILIEPTDGRVLGAAVRVIHSLPHASSPCSKHNASTLGGGKLQGRVSRGVSSLDMIQPLALHDTDEPARQAGELDHASIRRCGQISHAHAQYRLILTPTPSASMADYMPCTTICMCYNAGADLPCLPRTANNILPCDVGCDWLRSIIYLLIRDRLRPREDCYFTCAQEADPSQQHEQLASGQCFVGIACK